MIEAIEPRGSKPIDFGAREVCRSHLLAAIREIVFYQNYPSCHLLSNAPREIMRGYGKRHDIELFNDLKTLIEPIFPAKKVKVILDTFNKPYNSFKHSPDDTQLRPAFTEAVLAVAIRDYQRVFEELPSEMSMYLGWFAAKYPEVAGEHVGKFDRIFPSALKGSGAANEFAEAADLLETFISDPTTRADVVTPR